MALNDVPFQGVAEDLVVPLQLATDSDNRYILKLVDFALFAYSDAAQESDFMLQT